MGKVISSCPCRAFGAPRLLILASCVFLAGCATKPPAASLFCDFGPIRPTPEDTRVISDRLTNRIIVENETGERLCNWQP
ncbi:MAG: hypothetical protein AB7S41_11350 [Parvibaculaceae bacterium]